MDALEMLLVRSILQTVIVLIAILSSKTELLPASTRDKALVILQGLFSGVRVFLQFACLSFMPLGDALTLVFTEPLWTIILSKIVLKIHIGWWKLVFGIVLISGMVLCIQPPFIFPPQTVDSALINTTTESSSLMSLNATTTILNNYELIEDHPAAQSDGEKQNKIRQFIKITGVDKIKAKLHNSDGSGDDQYGTGTYYIGALLALGTAKCDSVSSSVMVFYSGIGGVILAVVCSVIDPSNRIVFNITSVPYDEWLILLMLGGSGLLGYYSMTRSLQLIPPTTVAVLRALEIILAYVAQACVMGEIPNILAISGSSMVMLSVIGFAMEETVYSCIDCY